MIRKVLIALVLAGAVFFLAKDEIVKLVLESKITTLTGLKARIAGLSYEFPSEVSIRNLRLDNPEGFEGPIFAVIPEGRLDFDLIPAILGRHFHIQNLRLYVSQIYLEKNEDGISNVSRLRPVAWARAAKAGSLLVPPEGKGTPFRVDRLELTLREVSFKDFTGKEERHASEDLQIENQVTENIRDPRALVYLVLVPFLYHNHFADLGLDPFSLHQALKKATAAG